MAQKRNAFYLGVFVLGGLLILVIMLMMLGGQNLLAKKVNYTLYFDKSVKGLNVGAPVMFRGVRVGKVEAIQFAKQLKKRRGVSWPIEVTIALDPAALDVGKDADYSSSSFVDRTARNMLLIFNGQRLTHEWIYSMVADNSLCAWLQTMSFLTGQLYIELDFSPDYPPSKNELQKLKEGVIPSRMSSFERISQMLKQKDRTDALNIAISQFTEFVTSGHARKTLDNLFSISERTREITDDASKIVSSFSKNSTRTGFSVLSVIAQANQALINANQLLTTLNRELPSILAEAKGTVVGAKGTFESAKTTLDNANNHLNELSAEVKRVLDSANGLCERLQQDADLENGPGAPLLKELLVLVAQMQKTFAEVEATVAGLQGMIRPDSQERFAIQNFMEQLNRAADAIRSMADTIQQNPESLLWGK